MPKILLIGCGSMGSALLTGWLSALDDPMHFYVVDRHKKAKNFTPGRHQLSIFKELEQAADLVPDYIVLAVKPQSYGEVEQQLSKFLGAKTVLISVMAGINLKRLRQTGAAKCVRCMPNLGVMVGQGLTICCGAYHQKSFINALFNAVGQTIWLPEKKLSVATAISGSGPGYLFYIASCLINIAMEQGLPQDKAAKMVVHTLAGAGQLMARSELNPTQLYRDMTRIKGTTAAGIEALKRDEVLYGQLAAAVEAATKRSEQLAQKK